MGKKLEKNGLWESSRWALPEHKRSINEHNLGVRRKPRVELDDQEWELIGRSLQRSQSNEEAVTITLYGEFKDTEIRGVVEAVGNAKVKLSGQWIDVRNIVGVVE